MSAQEQDHKVEQLSLMEQNLQNTSLQKQSFHLQLLETESAIKEVTSSPEAYKIVANIMIKADKDTIIKELTEKKEIVELRIKSLETQENKLKEKAAALQKEVLSGMEKKK